MARFAYELWDLETGNMVEAFHSEPEALAAVRDAVARHGAAYVDNWALAHATIRKVRSLAQGQALVERAHTVGSLNVSRA
jgi:hypothetical protein